MRSGGSIVGVPTLVTRARARGTVGTAAPSAFASAVVFYAIEIKYVYIYIYMFNVCMYLYIYIYISYRCMHRQNLVLALGL